MIIDAVKARQKHLEILEKYDVPITPLPEQSL
jgi:hypothetical protein